MDYNTIEQKKYEKAHKKVQEIKGFYVHLMVYVLVIPMIVFVNLEFVPGFHWFWYPMMGLGLGLFFHWFGVLGVDKLGFGKDWEERKIKEYMDKK